VKWLAILMALASLGGPTKSESLAKKCKSTSYAHKHKAACKKVKKPAANKPSATPAPNTPSAPRTPTDPDATPTPTPTPKPGASPTPTPTATATPTPTATPTYPKRTAVDLVEYDIRSSYATLAAGRVTFNANNLGEDDHNLTVRRGSEDLGAISLGPGDANPLVLDLAAGTYTLYCSLEDHEQKGMKLTISVR
jgi:plastocyanin